MLFTYLASVVLFTFDLTSAFIPLYHFSMAFEGEVVLNVMGKLCHILLLWQWSKDEATAYLCKL